MQSSARELLLLSVLFPAACGPEQVASGSDSDGSETGGSETGEDEAPLAPGDWLLYAVHPPDPDGAVSLRAVELAGLEQDGPGEPLVLLESSDYRELGPTPWGGYAVTIDDVYTLVGLDADGQVEVYPGVPEGVPARARTPKFSADGRVALFHGESSLPPDDYYWARFEHGHPVEGASLGQMTSQFSLLYWISPDGGWGVIGQREDLETEPRLYRLPLDPEPGEPAPLFDEGEALTVMALFDEHLIAMTTDYGLHSNGQLMLVDMSGGEAGERIPISPGPLGGGGTFVWYSPAGDAIMWLNVPFSYSTGDEKGSLWRVDIVDGVPQPAVQLSGPDEQVYSGHVYLAGAELLGWRTSDVGESPVRQLSWVHAVEGQLEQVRSIDAIDSIMAVSWSPDHQRVSWVDTPTAGERRRSVAALDGPAAGVPLELEAPDALGAAIWLGERLVWGAAEDTQLWSTILSDDGAEPSTQLHPALVEPVDRVRAREPVVGREAVLVDVTPAPDAAPHIQLLRLDGDGDGDAWRIDEDPRQQRLVHQLVRE